MMFIILIACGILAHVHVDMCISAGTNDINSEEKNDLAIIIKELIPPGLGEAVAKALKVSYVYIIIIIFM